MVENTVVKEQLTDTMVEAGAELTRKLDEIGLPMTAAFWFFDPEINEWRLLFASPEAATKGPIAVYGKIQQALDQLKDKAAAAQMSAIGLIDTHAELVRSLRKAVSTGNGVSRIRFSKNVSDGRFIDDALIYRAV